MPPGSTPKTVLASPGAANELRVTKPGAIFAAARGFRVGMSVEAARKTGISFRVVELDGTRMASTMAFRPGRLKVAVKGGVITRIVSLG